MYNYGYFDYFFHQDAEANQKVLERKAQDLGSTIKTLQQQSEAVPLSM